MKTVTLDGKMLAEALKALRESGADDDTLPKYSAAVDDFAITAGNTLAELDELRAKAPGCGCRRM